MLPEHGPTPEQVAALMAEIGSPLSWWADREAVAWREPAPDGAPEPAKGRIVCAAVQPLDPLL
ncbi:hypothetical protein ACI3PL_24035, partial [Lacticaseibacillus paracasei]